MNSFLKRVLVAAVSLSTIAAPFAGGIAAADERCGIGAGTWSTIAAPRFASGPQRITGYAVDRLSRGRIFVTNGESVSRTTDGGCKWKTVFSLPPQPSPESQATSATGTILSVALAERNPARVLLLVEERAAQGRRPHVVRSDDGGSSWQSGDVGLPPVGAPEALSLAPSDANVAYIALDIGDGTIDALFASNDGGASWTLRSNPVTFTPSMGISGITVDPAAPRELWAFGSGGLYYSADGGTTFAPIADFAQSVVNAVDVFHAGESAARVAGFRPGQRDALVSVSGAAGPWLSITTPARLDSVAHGDTAERVYVTAGGRLWAFHAESFTWIDLHAPAGALTDVRTDLAGGVYARNASSIVVYTGPTFDDLPHALPDKVFKVPLVEEPEALRRRPPSLTPARRKVVLDPGESRTVRYRLDVPDRPLPVNVFFLVDASDSMGPAINELKEGVAHIVNRLGDERISLKVGVGSFRAYPDRFPPRRRCDEDEPATQECEKNYVFRRVLDMQPPGAAVTTALETLESDAGGFYKSHLGALYHLATGEPDDVFPPGPDSNDVPPGLNVSFEDNSLRIVVHATDEAFGHGVERPSGGATGVPVPPDIPSYEKAAQALNAKNIKQIGLSIGREPRRDLRRIAAATETFAPPSGVDCGNGYVVAAGDPLVCQVGRKSLSSNLGLVDAIVNLVQAVPETTDVEFSAKGNERVVRRVSPDLARDIVLQIANDLPFEVTYRCPLDLAGERLDVEVRARDTQAEPGDALLDSATTRIVCRETPADPVVPAAAVLGALPVIALLPPPPPPPVSQLTSASQAQSQAQAQAGAAFSEEREHQVAVAAAYREAMQTENVYELEMASYRGRQEPVSPYLTLGAGAVLASLAYAGMMLARHRAQVAPQRQRRR